MQVWSDGVRVPVEQRSYALGADVGARRAAEDTGGELGPAGLLGSGDALQRLLFGARGLMRLHRSGRRGAAGGGARRAEVPELERDRAACEPVRLQMELRTVAGRAEADHVRGGCAGGERERQRGRPEEAQPLRLQLGAADDRAGEGRVGQVCERGERDRRVLGQRAGGNRECQTVAGERAAATTDDAADPARRVEHRRRGAVEGAGALQLDLVVLVVLAVLAGEGAGGAVAAAEVERERPCGSVEGGAEPERGRMLPLRLAAPLDGGELAGDDQTRDRRRLEVELRGLVAELELPVEPAPLERGLELEGALRRQGAFGLHLAASRLPTVRMLRGRGVRRGTETEDADEEDDDERPDDSRRARAGQGKQ